MTLFSAPDDPWSHRTRIVIAGKAIEIEIVDVAPGKYPEDLLDLNPYHTTPTLIDRDLVLYDSRVIMEYLDERFPHPPLMPVDPVSRARARLALYQIEHDWYDCARKIDRAGARRTCRSCARSCATTCLASADLFKLKPFFLSDEFSMVDATIAPILWRLPRYEIDLPPQAQPILKYASTIFSRPAFPRQPVRDRAGDAPGMNDRARNSKRPYLIRAHARLDDGQRRNAARHRRCGEAGVRSAARLRQGRQGGAEPVVDRDAAARHGQRLDRIRSALRRRRAPRAHPGEHGAGHLRA
jgi:RNA polymerase-associated protein